MKRKVDGLADEMAELRNQHQTKEAESEALLAEKDGNIKQLEGELAAEKHLKEVAEGERTTLLKKYEEEKASWLDLR